MSKQTLTAEQAAERYAKSVTVGRLEDNYGENAAIESDSVAGFLAGVGWYASQQPPPQPARYVIDPNVKEHTGFHTIEEHYAYEKGYAACNELIPTFIAEWDGKETNSGLKAALKSKWQQLKVFPVEDDDFLVKEVRRKVREINEKEKENLLLVKNNNDLKDRCEELELLLSETQAPQPAKAEEGERLSDHISEPGKKVDNGEQLYRWVKASERLPAKRLLVIVKNEDGYVRAEANMGHNAGWGIATDRRFAYDRTKWLEPYTPTSGDTAPSPAFTLEQVKALLNWMFDNDIHPFPRHLPDKKLWLQGGMSVAKNAERIIAAYLQSLTPSNTNKK